MRALLQRFDIRVSVAYGTIATLWIILSDTIMVGLFGEETSALAAVSMIKGLVYVLVTALALFIVLRAELHKRDRVERALQDDVAERTRTLNALRQSESRFATIFHGSPVPTGITRLEDGHIVDVNDAIVKMLGYERHELIGRTVGEMDILSYPLESPSTIQAMLEMGSVQNREIQGRTKSGDTIYVLASAETIDLDGIPHIVSMFYDITEQKKLEEEIRYHAQLLDNLSDAVISTDTDFKIRSWNPAAEAIYGWKAEEVIGKQVTEITQNEYLDATTDEASINHLDTQGIWRGEVVQRRKDGSKIPILASVSLVTDSAGKKAGVVAINRDITSRKLMEIALRESEQRFRKMADTAPAMLWLSDQTGNVTFLSRRWYEFTGQTEATGLGWGWLDAVHPDDQATIQESFLAAYETQLRSQFECRVLEHTNIEYHWVIATGNPRFSADGEFLGFIGSIIDVTEHRLAQEAIQEAERRQMELEKEKEVLELKEHFISVISHEFRTPLAVIMSSADLVHSYYDRMSRERQLNHIQDVLSQATFMLTLLDNVLTVNKARAGKLAFQPEPLDLISYCETAIERIQAFDVNGNHNFVFTQEGDLSDVMLDTKLLQHILVNLLSNAVKYSPEGGEVRLEVNRQDEDVLFVVSDQGIGIPPDGLAQLYDPFVRATNTGNIGGTGLGMAIVKESVESHKGTISCETRLESGTTFTVRLPVVTQVRA